MWRGIAAGKKGGKLSDIGHAIEEYVNSQGKYGILREYGGHGIGNCDAHGATRFELWPFPDRVQIWLKEFV
jgi:methionine aminopeptidase